MYIDTHAHLNFEKFDQDYVEVLNRAFEVGVKGIINVGSNLETSRRAIEIAKTQEKGVYAAISLHPIHVKDESFDEALYEELAKEKKVVALGETGLDYYYDSSTAERQKDVFRKLIKISQKISKPLIIHSRDAGEDVLSLLMESGEVTGVMHCYQEDWNFAKVILDMGLLISFTGLITFGKSEKTLEVIEKAPLEKIMIETDCPFMTPEPYRGRRNEPAYVPEVAKKIAEIKKVSLEEVAEQTSKNAIELFALDI